VVNNSLKKIFMPHLEIKGYVGAPPPPPHKRLAIY